MAGIVHAAHAAAGGSCTQTGPLAFECSWRGSTIRAGHVYMVSYTVAASQAGTFTNVATCLPAGDVNLANNEANATVTVTVSC